MFFASDVEKGVAKGQIDAFALWSVWATNAARQIKPVEKPTPEPTNS